MRYRRSEPVSFSQPAGRGSVASDSIRARIRRRSLFAEIASISFTADGLMKSLYLATPLQVFDDILELEKWLRGPLLKRCEILGIFSEAVSHRVVDELRDRAVRLGRLEAERAMYVRVEVDRGTLLDVPHAQIVTSERPNVKTSQRLFPRSGPVAERTS